MHDLHSMKAAGINRAFIGNIGLDVPYGNIKMLSEEWWKIITALKTATELDIDIGFPIHQDGLNQEAHG